MMEGLRGWLLTVIYACLLCALAGALMPRGPARRAGSLVCGLVLLCAVLSPLPGLRLEEGRLWLEEYLAGVERREQALEEQVGQEMKAVIEEEYAAYIVDKARQLGIACRARVSCRADGEGLMLPEQVEVAGVSSDEAQSRLTQIIEEELLVPPERQTYYSGEELP